jgi:hypothetical protein
MRKGPQEHEAAAGLVLSIGLLHARTRLHIRHDQPQLAICSA